MVFACGSNKFLHMLLFHIYLHDCNYHGLHGSSHFRKMISSQIVAYLSCPVYAFEVEQVELQQSDGEHG
ncbi:hypothetical protein D3C73_1484430 [compost metagenome]